MLLTNLFLHSPPPLVGAVGAAHQNWTLEVVMLLLLWSPQTGSRGSSVCLVTTGAFLHHWTTVLVMKNKKQCQMSTKANRNTQQSKSYFLILYLFVIVFNGLSLAPGSHVMSFTGLLYLVEFPAWWQTGSCAQLSVVLFVSFLFFHAWSDVPEDNTATGRFIPCDIRTCQFLIKVVPWVQIQTLVIWAGIKTHHSNFSAALDLGGPHRKLFELIRKTLFDTSNHLFIHFSNNSQGLVSYHLYHKGYI